MSSLFIRRLAPVFLACIVSVQSVSLGPGESKPNRKGPKCDKILTAPSGTISSPNYGFNQVYPDNSACTWTIQAPLGKTINLHFRDFVVETSGSCRSDYLLLFDGQNKTARKVGRYCTAKPAPFTSSSNYIYLEFHSDTSLAYRGFFATYNISLPTTAKPTQWRSRPKFKSSVLNETAIVGDMVKLQCEAEGTPEPSITWRKYSVNVKQHKNVIIENSPFKSVLTVKKISKNDQGIYSCIASNGFGPPIEAHGFLAVEKRKIPLITKITAGQTVSVGRRMQLTCEAEGLAPMRISFTEKDRELKSRTCNQRIPCKIQHTKMFVEDTSVTCEVSNTAGNSTRDITITVEGPPVIIHPPENQTVHRSGDAINFTCEAVGKNLKISWLQDNEHISDGVVTRAGRSVLSLSVKKNATLTCTVEGQDGKTSKTAKVLLVEAFSEKEKIVKTLKDLQLSVFPKSVNVTYEESATVRCHATGDPPLQVSWKSSDPKATSTNTTRISPRGVWILELQSLKKTVTVFCIASNERDTVNSSTTITIITEAPEVLPTKSGAMNDNIKLILGAGGGVLVLTVLIILFIVFRRKRSKKIEKENQRPSTETTTAENENLISNPAFSSNSKELIDTKPGVEMLHYPHECIENTETLLNGANIEMFLGRAVDLPFSPGEHSVVVRSLKNPDPSEEIKDDFDLEASLLANLVHPNVVRLMAVCIKTPPLCLVFEYSSYGFLDEYLLDCDSSDIDHEEKTKSPIVRDLFTQLTNVDRLSMAKQIASGMKYLADKGYVHQELRARNCLVFKDLQVKVANLGLHWAKPDQNFFVMDQVEKQSFPVRWLPAEVILYGEYTQSADVWSYGVLVWEIFSNGQLPYTGIHDNDVASYVRGCNILPRPKICPHDVYEVMKTCWEMAPLQRPNFKSLEKTMTALHAGVPV